MQQHHHFLTISWTTLPSFELPFLHPMLVSIQIYVLHENSPTLESSLHAGLHPNDFPKSFHLPKIHKTNRPDFLSSNSLYHLDLHYNIPQNHSFHTVSVQL